jgi:hypothetical protein
MHLGEFRRAAAAENRRNLADEIAKGRSRKPLAEVIL